MLLFLKAVIWPIRFMVIIFAGILTIMLATGSPAYSSDLQVTISLDSIKSAADVTVAVAFNNVGDSDIVLYSFDGKVQPSMGGILKFAIVRNNLDTFLCEPCGRVPKYPYEEDTVLLTPGDSVGERICLTSYYTSSSIRETIEPDSTEVLCKRRWPTGNYSVQCIYEYRHLPSYEGGRRLWRGKGISNTVKFSVSDPN